MAQTDHRVDTVSTGFSDLEVLIGGTGPNLMFLHGEEGQRGWLDHHAHLADNFTVIAPTLPGVGQSQRPGWLESVPDMAKVLLGALDELALESCILGGASMGGWIAAEMASMVPEKFGGLVLVGNQGQPTGHLDTPDLFLTPYRRYISLGYADPDAESFKTLWPDDPDDEGVAHDLEICELAARLGFKPYMYDRSLLPSLARFKNPSLLVWGNQDIITPAAIAEQFKDGLANAEIKFVAQAGHYVHLEQPQRFAEAFVEFAESLSSGKGT